MSNGAISIKGKFGANKVDLRIDGADLRDLLGAAALLGMLDEYRKLDTDKERDRLSREAYGVADSMLRVRKTAR